MRDLTQVAIDTLTASGTDRGLALAAEIERGRNRRQDPKRYERPTMAQMEAEMAAHRQRQEQMLTQLRPAQPAEWAQWVDTYLKSTRNPKIHRYNHTMTYGQVYVATCDLEVLPLYGALALQIILPRGIRDWGGDTGHTGLYGYSDDGVTYRGFHDCRWPDFVPVYTDTELQAGER
jgi:hypothetical protein